MFHRAAARVWRANVQFILIPCTFMYFCSKLGKFILYLEYCAVHNSCRCCHEDINYDVTLCLGSTNFYPSGTRLFTQIEHLGIDPSWDHHSHISKFCISQQLAFAHMPMLQLVQRAVCDCTATVERPLGGVSIAVRWQDVFLLVDFLSRWSICI